MPLYEYRCDECDETFEVLRRITEKDDVRCPSCERPARKLLSGFSVGGCGTSSDAGISGGGCGGGGLGGG
ncbi:MAG: zinc ribbon domain-containing protein [Deltaproteobacteria bacterium]|nr:zinc ribbon domain-containing protein [Deltaproteobacteria bacterium]